MFAKTAAVAFHTEEVITWIKVEHPKLDIVGLILGAFSLTGALVLAAMLLGVLLGLTLIYRRRTEPASLRPRLDIQNR
jgi:hypothetical protein